MQHWFIYYKVPQAEAAVLAARVRRMMGEVGAATGVRGRLLRRIEDAEGAATLMEQYDRIADPSGFAAALTEAEQRAELGNDLLAQRKVERFGDF